MSGSARVFAAFENYCAANGLRASDYQITITPLHSKAECDFKIAWISEWEKVTRNKKEHGQNFYEGHIMAIPFKIETSK